MMPARKSRLPNKQTPLSKAQTAKKDKKPSRSQEVRDDVPIETKVVNPFNREQIELKQDLPLYIDPSMASERHRRIPQPEVEQPDQTREPVSPPPVKLPRHADIFSRAKSVQAGSVKNEWSRYYEEVQQGQRMRVERFDEPIMALIPVDDLHKLELMDYLEATVAENISDEQLRELGRRLAIIQESRNTEAESIRARSIREALKLRQRVNSISSKMKHMKHSIDDIREELRELSKEEQEDNLPSDNPPDEH